MIPERGPAAYVAEFIGTFALVFFVTLRRRPLRAARPSDAELAQPGRRRSRSGLVR